MPQQIWERRAEKGKARRVDGGGAGGKAWGWRERASEGKRGEGRLGSARSLPLAAFSHISAGRGRISHALPLRPPPPPPPLGPARAGGSSARELAGLAAAGRPAALLPPPGSAATTAFSRGSRGSAPFTSDEGREEGDEATRGLLGTSRTSRGDLGLTTPPPLLCKTPKTKPRSPEPAPGRPRFTSPAATEGSSDVRFPVRLVPDTRSLSPARAATAEGKSWEPPRPRRRSPKGDPREKITGLGRGADLSLEPQPAPASGPASPLPVHPPCTCCASCLWRVPCSPLR